MKSPGKLKNINQVLLSALLFLHFGSLGAQSVSTIKGSIINKDRLPVVYSTVALFRTADSTLVTGTLTDSAGRFEFTTDLQGNCFLRISFIGYEVNTTNINIQSRGRLETGEIILREKAFEITEAEVFGERIKARQELDKTSYFVNKQMQEASSTAIDMVKFIPGVQVDLFQNVLLEGKSNILILINGVERENGFLQQLSSDRIDRVEVNNQPGSKYPGEISGVINIILKPENKQGFNGQLCADLPTNFDEVYAFPSYSFNLTRNKINLFTSYNGELSYFNIKAENTRNIFSGPFESRINKIQYLRQKNWSHKFHYGIDYQPNNKNVLNIYGFINPTSYEFDGTVQIRTIAREKIAEYWEAEKEDADLNLSWFNSLYYQHTFDKEGSELMLELNQYKFNGTRQSTLTPGNSEAPLVNISMPGQRLYTGKLDLAIPIASSLKIETGFRKSFSLFSDSELSSFRHTESIHAAYASIIYAGERFRFSSGLRMEHARLKMEERFDTQSLTLLPNFSAQYDLPKEQCLKITYRKSVIRPRMHHLNPNISFTDPYTIYHGNPDLTASIVNDIALDYSLNFKKNFISVGGFYEQADHSIESLTVLIHTGMFENSTENLGSIKRIGINLKGSIKPHKNILVNPSLKLYNISTRANTVAIENYIRNKRQMAMEAGLSVAATFKYNITVASILNYYNAKASIQGYRFEDLLYFISVEKSFKDKFKAGITFALPFKGEFTYQGYSTEGFQFSEYAEDKLQLSLIPVWLKFTYNFSSGIKANRIISDRDFKDPNLKEGF